MHRDPDDLLEALLLAASKLSVLQMRLANLALEAATAAFKAPYTPDRQVESSMAFTEEQVEAAATALKAAMTDRSELGFQILVRTNFSDDRIREMAKAALDAALSHPG